MVQEAVASPLSAWESFYVIVGSSAAALTGLQFVVMALVADSDDMRRSNRDIAAFGSPTVVHFCVALGVAAILSAPWPSLAGVAITLGALGAAGLVYGGIVVRRALRATYRPVLEDWIFHAVLPLIAYAAIFVSALALRPVPRTSLFAIGAATVLLVYVGIHNAWDTVTYIALRDYAAPQQGAEGAAAATDARADTPAAPATPPAPA